MLAVGQWGPQPITDRRGRPAPGLTVTIYEPDEITLATIYTDQSGSTPLENPLPTVTSSLVGGVDPIGNVSWYAAPGPYVMVVDRAGEEIYRGAVTVAADSLGGLGSVVTVDGQAPDADGNVDLSGLYEPAGAAADLVASLGLERDARVLADDQEALARASDVADLLAAIELEAQDRADEDGLRLLASSLGTPGGPAPVGSDGFIPQQFIASTSYASVTPVANQAEMLALTGQVIAPHPSAALRLDDGLIYVLTALPASTLAHWSPVPNAAATPIDLSGLQPLSDTLTLIAALVTTAHGRAFLTSASPAATRTLLSILSATETTTAISDAVATAIAYAVDRTHHTGAQPTSTVTGLDAALSSLSITQSGTLVYTISPSLFDGVQDIGPTIRAALAVLKTAGGGVLLVPPVGTGILASYETVSGLRFGFRIPSNVHVTSTGMPTIKLAPDWCVGGLQNRMVSNYDAFNNAAGSPAAVNVGLSNVILDGNAAHQSTADKIAGAQFQGVRTLRVNNIVTKNHRGIDGTTNESFGLDALQCFDVELDAFATCDDGGVTASGISANSSTGVKIRGHADRQGFNGVTVANCRAVEVDVNVTRNGTNGFNSEGSEVIGRVMAGGTSAATSQFGWPTSVPITPTNPLPSGTPMGNGRAGVYLTNPKYTVLEISSKGNTQEGVVVQTAQGVVKLFGISADNTLHGLKCNGGTTYLVDASGLSLSGNNAGGVQISNNGDTGLLWQQIDAAGFVMDTSHNVLSRTLAVTGGAAGTRNRLNLPFGAFVYITGGTGVTDIGVSGHGLDLPAYLGVAAISGLFVPPGGSVWVKSTGTGPSIKCQRAS